MIIKITTFIIVAFLLAMILTATFMLLVKRGFIALNELTPDIDEVKEILRGNRAVSEYFSRVLASFIIGIAIILSSAVIATLTLIR